MFTSKLLQELDPSSLGWSWVNFLYDIPSPGLSQVAAYVVVRNIPEDSHYNSVRISPEGRRALQDDSFPHIDRLVAIK